MKQIIRNSLFVPFLFILCETFGQNEGTMYFMNSLPQVTYLNPALTPRYKFSLGIPGSSIYMQQDNNGFTYNDFGKREGDVVKVDLNKLHDAMADKNYITNIAQADVLRFSMKVNARMYLTINSTVKTYNRVMLPRDILGVFINGTLTYVNNTATLSPQVDVLTYVENGAGASYVVNRKLTVGAKVKLLKGLVNATTNNARFDLSLDEDYGISIQGDADIRSSGLHNLDSSDYVIEDNWRDYLSNNGFAFDLGATYKVTERLTVGLSAIDIGGIRWKNDLYGYQLDPERANYTFRGIDMERLFNNDESYLGAERDSIRDRFEFQDGEIDSYRTPLPTKVYLSATYRLKRNFNAGLLLFAEKFNKRFSPGVSASLCKDFGRRLTASVSYTITNRSFNNIGAGLSLNFAPFQFYIVGDNMLGGPIALMTQGNMDSYLNSMHHFNLRTGLNFVFGWDKTQEKQPDSRKTR